METNVHMIYRPVDDNGVSFRICHSDSLTLRIFVYKEASRKYSASACKRYNPTLNSTDRTIIRKA